MNDPSDRAVEMPRSTRVLIVEDEAMVAENLRADLDDAGFEVVGIAARVEHALRLIENVGCDVAILDANLAGISAVPVAAALSSRGLPFVLLSGYSREQLQRDFADALFVQKPYRIGEIIYNLHSLSSYKR